MKICKIIIPIIIAIVWLTGVGDIIDVPLQTNLYIGILPCVVIINLQSANRAIIP